MKKDLLRCILRRQRGQAAPVAEGDAGGDAVKIHFVWAEYDLAYDASLSESVKNMNFSWGELTPVIDAS